LLFKRIYLTGTSDVILKVSMNGDASPVFDALWVLPAGVGYPRHLNMPSIRTNRYEEILRLLEIWNLDDLEYVFFFFGVAVVPMWILQFVFFSFCSWTPGCWVLRLRVITVEGAIPGPKRSLIRTIGAVASVPCLGAGWLFPLIYHDERTWSDIWSDTRLVVLE